MPFKHRLIAMLITALGLLSACTERPPPQFRIATNSWPGYESLYLARELGYLDGTGIHMIETPNNSEVVQLLRNGELEAATLTLDEVLTIVQDGYALRVVLIMDLSHGADAVLAGPGINELIELRGKRIAVEHIAVGAVMLDALLKQAGLDVHDVQVVPLTVDRHLQAYLAGNVDAVVTFEPTVTRLRDAGAHVLFDSSKIPERIIDVLVAPADLDNAQQASLRQLIAAHFRALSFLKANPEQAAELMAPRLQLTPEALLATLDGIVLPDLATNHRLLAGDTPSIQAKARALMQLMLARGMLRHPAPLQRLFTAEMLPESRHP